MYDAGHMQAKFFTNQRQPAGWFVALDPILMDCKLGDILIIYWMGFIESA